MFSYLYSLDEERFSCDQHVIILCFESEKEAELASRHLPGWYYDVLGDSSSALFLVGFAGADQLEIYDTADTLSWLAGKWGIIANK